MSLLALIDRTSAQVMQGEMGLDDALASIEQWLDDNAAHLEEEERREFSASLDEASTNDDRSLVRSVLKLHATRLLYRADEQNRPNETPSEDDSPYTQARDAFNATIRRSEIGINEARIDVAIANAHHLLGNMQGNRRWLQQALSRLPDLAAPDMVAMAGDMPAPPLPRLNLIKRIGIRLLGIRLERLAERSHNTLIQFAEMQENQIVLIAHLIGTSFETINDRQRADRAYRVAAHLITRYWGMPHVEAAQLLHIAEDLHRPEREAARILSQQALDLCGDDVDCQERAQRLLDLN